MASFDQLLAAGQAPRDGEEKVAYEHPLVERYTCCCIYPSTSPHNRSGVTPQNSCRFERCKQIASVFSK